MSIHPPLSLPWLIGQRVEWEAGGRAHAGRLTTWRGPSEGGVYVLTVLLFADGCETRTLVTLHAPDPLSPTSCIREAARYA